MAKSWDSDNSDTTGEGAQPQGASDPAAANESSGAPCGAREAVGSGTAVFEPGGDLVCFNDRYAALMEFPGAFIKTGMSHDEILRYDADRNAVNSRPEKTRIVNGNEFLYSELTLPSGNVCAVTRTPLGDGGFVISVKPVPGRDQWQQEDAGARHFIYSAIDNMADGVRVFDRDLKLVAFNKVAIELSMYPEHLFRLGTPIEDFLRYSEARTEYVRDPEVIGERFKRIREGEPRTVDQVLPDGRIVRKTRRPIPGGGMVSTYTDITELKQAQVETARQAEFIATVVDNINHGVRVIGPDGNLLLWNKRYQKIFNYPDELLKTGRPYEDITRFNSIKTGRPEHEIEDRVRHRLKRNRIKSRLNRVKKYADDLVIHQNMEPMPGGGFITTYTDITELEKARALLLEEKRRAELANRSKTEFLANMSHELRTPLNAIIGFSEIIHQELKGPIGTPCYKDYIANILESGSLLLELINDILDLSKVESGEAPVESGTIDVAKTINSCLVMTKERAEKGGIEIALTLPDPFPRLKADARMIKQVLLNLLSNAIKFTEPGGRVEVHAELDEDDWLILTVADTGIGIGEENIAAVLEPFTQVANTLTKHHTGTGLGLAIVKSLVEAHGGEFHLQSAMGDGTTAIVRLPTKRKRTTA
jgi:signal transduction histidine kinase